MSFWPWGPSSRLNSALHVVTSPKNPQNHGMDWFLWWWKWCYQKTQRMRWFENSPISYRCDDAMVLLLHLWISIWISLRERRRWYWQGKYTFLLIIQRSTWPEVLSQLFGPYLALYLMIFSGKLIFWLHEEKISKWNKVSMNLVRGNTKECIQIEEARQLLRACL